MPIDPLTQAKTLLTKGHYPQAIVEFNKAIADPKLGLFKKTSAYLGRSQAAEALAPKRDVPLKNPFARKYALETHRWLQTQPKIPGLTDTNRMNCELKIAQGLLLAKAGPEALLVGNEALKNIGPEFKDRDLLQQMKVILGQVYEGEGDLPNALKLYDAALKAAPHGVESPTIQQAVWELQGGNDHLKPSDWQNLIARFPGNPHLPGVYGNYAAYLEQKGDLPKLAAVVKEYHHKFDATTPTGSFDSCSIDWNLAMGYDQAKQTKLAYSQIASLKSRCGGNPVGQLAEQYLQIHPAPAKAVSLLGAAVAIGAVFAFAVGKNRKA